MERDILDESRLARACCSVCTLKLVDVAVVGKQRLEVVFVRQKECIALGLCVSGDLIANLVACSLWNGIGSQELLLRCSALGFGLSRRLGDWTCILDVGSARSCGQLSLSFKLSGGAARNSCNTLAIQVEVRTSRSLELQTMNHIVAGQLVLTVYRS